MTIAGAQLGSKIDTGEWAYSFTDILQRLWDTTKESLLTFGLTNIPSTVHNVGTQDSKHDASNNNVGTGLEMVESLDDFVATPQKLAGITGQELHNYLVASGYDVQPLSRGSFKGIPYEDGGGFKVNWGGDRILQYHPAKSSHHEGAYFKISSGETGTIRIDMDGNIIK